MESAEINNLQKIATQVRRDIIRMTNHAKSGHPGGALGAADLLTVLFFHTMHIDPDKYTDTGIGEDVFFLSNGHLSALFYSILARRGYFDVDELSTFRKLNSRLQGHPASVDNIPGIRISSGSLGQGLSVAIGHALAKKLNNDNHLVYVLCGDGELQEGQNWEAFMFAAHHKVDNLIAIIDFNNKQIDGNVSDVMSLGSLEDKMKAFGWYTLNMDGHSYKDIIASLQVAGQVSGQSKPVCIIMHSVMGKGVDFMENNHHWHGVAPDDDQTIRALAQLPETLGDFKII
ncbi:MAG: transketolase [Sphingobacteriales bacterium]|nr:transketolase [Sphingobacteriales bacterium]